MTGKTLLILEDDPRSLYAFETVLQDRGHQVVACRTAKEAQTYLRVNFDAAIIDVRLPDKPGTTVAEELREIHPYVRLIFVTAYNGVREIQAAFPDAAVFLKPVDINTIVAML
jgi:CheY-like chemotaxis protein